MRPLTKIAFGSAWATVLVLAAAAGAKVRIDARAHRLSAESLRAHALEADDVRELEAAGEEDARAIACYTPFDPTPRRAVSSLALTALLLENRGGATAALRVFDLGIAATDASALLFAPLGAEREELEALRDTLVGRMHAPAGTSAGEEPAAAPEPPATPPPEAAPSAAASPSAPVETAGPEGDASPSPASP